MLVVQGAIACANTTVDLSVSDSFGAAVDAWTVEKSGTGVAYGTAAVRAFVAWAYVSGSPGSGTVTVTRSGGTSAECFITFTTLEFDGVDTTDPFAQVSQNASTGGGSTLNTNLSASPDGANYLVAAAGDYWGGLTKPASLAYLDQWNSYGTSTVHQSDHATAEDSTPSGTTYQWTGLNGDATAAILVEIQVPQTVSDDAPAEAATSTGTGHDATVSTAAMPTAESADATGTANDPTITTQSSTPSPDAATATGVVFEPKLTVDVGAQAATATGTGLDGDASPLVLVDAEVAEATGLAFDTIGDVIEPPIVVPVSDVDLLEMNVSQRRESYRFDLLDKAGNVIGVVHPVMPAKITNNTGQAIKRRLTSFKIAPSEFADVNTLTDRVRPVMVLQNGNEYPLGIFLFADASNARFSYGQTLDGTLVDQNLILGQPLSTTISFPQGTYVVDAMRAVYDRAGITNAIIDASHADIGSAVAWQSGKSVTSIKVLDDLSKLAGFYPPYFDNLGIPRARTATDLTTATAQLVYADGDGDTGRIIAGSIVAANDLLQAPNRYVVIDTSATENPVTATYDLPATAPHAVVHRGFAIPRTIEAPGVGNVDQAMALAMLTAQTEAHTYETIHFQSPTDPRHDTYDVVSFLGNTYMEVSWSITCSPGGPMEHEINRQYVATT